MEEAVFKVFKIIYESVYEVESGEYDVRYKFKTVMTNVIIETLNLRKSRWAGTY